MAPPQENSEPSIEEILDSIRQIIADDEEGDDGKAASAPPPPPPPPQKPVTPKPADDDIIELRDRVEEPVARPAPPPPPPVREPEKTVHVAIQEPEPEPYMSTNDDIEAIIKGMEEAKSRTGKGKPVCVLLHTVMGNGVDFMMHTHAWHGKAPNDEQLATALTQNTETLGDY